MDWCYTLTDAAYEESKIEKISFILDSMHYDFTFIFLNDVIGSVYVSNTGDE